jgi:hypothetical protein
MELIARILSFIAMFGAMWLWCMRASDWGTDRWQQPIRAYVLLLAPGAWLILVFAVRNYVYLGDLRSDAMSIATVLGFPTAIATYTLLAWIRPGTLGAYRITWFDRN